MDTCGVIVVMSNSRQHLTLVRYVSDNLHKYLKFLFFAPTHLIHSLDTSPTHIWMNEWIIPFLTFSVVDERMDVKDYHIFFFWLQKRAKARSQITI